jgi:hypothetical protein
VRELKLTKSRRVVEEQKGEICGHRETPYKTVVKLTFAKGASLKDPSGLFNSSLDGKVRRAIDIREGEAIDDNAFRALIRAAVILNESSGRTQKMDGRISIKRV